MFTGVWSGPLVKCGCVDGRGYFAECGKLSRGNLQKINCGTFRKVPLIAFPHSAAEKFRISASFTVKLSFDDLIWLDIAAYFNV